MRMRPADRAATLALALCLLVLLGLAAGAVAGLIPAAFAPALNHPLGPPGCTPNETCSELPLEVAAGDFNGDGDLDIATAENRSNSITVLLGDGTGALAPHFRASCADAPSAIASGALNSDDAIIDLVVAKELGNRIGVFIGRGDGTFEAEVEYQMGIGPQDVVLADFDNDDVLDVATTDLFVDSVSVRLGAGDGTFGDRLVNEVGDGPQRLAVGLLNDDAIVDLAVTVTEEIPARLVTLIGNGDGTFLFAGTASAAIVAESPNGVTLADLDEDGNLDAAVACETDDLVDVLLGDGAGGFDDAVHYLVGGFPEAIAAGDYNADGTLDLASADSFGTIDFDGSVSILLGNGDGTFADPVSVEVDPGPYGIVAVDLNGDLQLDLVTANADSDSVSVLRNLATPAGTATATLTPGGATPTASATAAEATATGTPSATPPPATATATHSATATATETVPPTTTSTASPTAEPGCVGDCDGNAAVAINELIRGVRIALGESTVGDCPAFDGDDNGSVSINELVGAVAAALEGCPS